MTTAERSARRQQLRVNGRSVQVDAPDNRSLLDVLHDDLGMGDVRYGCGEGVCGTCTVLIDGEPISACLMFVAQAQGHDVTTLCGLTERDGAGDPRRPADSARELHPLQETFLRRGALQCGFCTPGMILAAYSLVERTGEPTREEVAHELVGNLCRCTGYAKIFEAVEEYSIARRRGAATS